MDNLPSGTVTFLFTDIEGSTKLAQAHPDKWETLRERHHAILQAAMDAHNGYVFQIIGDAFCAAFHTAGDALRAAIKSQTDLYNEDWGETPIKVRMGIHTGKAEIREDGEYQGYLAMSRVQRLMSAGHGGQVLISQDTEILIRDELPKGVSLRDMGERRLKDLIRPEHIHQLVIPNLPVDFPPLKTLDIYRHNLPAQMTSFVGRAKEIAEVKQALNDHRLVTLTGSGGTGKTRLSLQVADKVLEQFRDGVWFVELAPLSDPALVPNTIASVLGVREEQGRPLMATLLDWLSNKEILFVLDNCEHLVEACAKFVAAGLQTNRGTRILASSREALGISGETAYRVPSLEVPNPKDPISIDTITQYTAVRLFIERATQALGTFSVTNANASVVAQICYRLDGIPLAIELAATRVKVLSVEQIAERLDDRFRLLTGGSRTALPHQQTLRALIDWSYQLLSEQERLLFRRLAVFVGGWTLEAAESICGFGGIESVDILDLLSHLVDKSLVVVENIGKESRYRRLETIRQYAREKLFETEEAAQIRDRHLDYFRTLAERAEIEILNSNQVTWLKRLQDEFDNIRAALEWSQEKRVEDGLRLGSAIWRFCLRFGYTDELLEKLNQLLKYPQETMRTLVRAKTLRALSLLTGVGQGDRIRQYALAEESLAIYKEAGNQHGEAAGLYALGVVAHFSSNPKAALGLYLQSLALYRSMNDKTNICDVLIVISQVSTDTAQRQACLEEALTLARERGDAITMAGALDNLGTLAMDLGNFPQARAWLEESLELQLPLGAPGYMSTLRYLGELAMYEGNLTAALAYYDEVCAMSRKAGMMMSWQYLWSLAKLGYIALREGDIVQAKEMFTQSIQQFQKANNLIGVVYELEGLASLYVHQNQPERASRLFAWTDAIREKMNNHRAPVEQASVEKDLAIIHSQIDVAEFTRLSAEGRGMTTEQAIVLALKESQ